MTRRTTVDDAGAVKKALRFYTVESLGAKRHLTPEGFLLCEDVPVARTGWMIYGPNETPIPAGPDGIVKVHRDESEVFRPEFLASLAGKPVVNDHPSTGDHVSPGNWRDFAVGVGMNPRRGAGIQSDFLLMDLLIQDEQAIKDIMAGKREISLGYDADYDEDEDRPGIGKQYNLYGNHIALVDSGRCGPRCAIGDRNTVPHITTEGEADMAKVTDKKLSWYDRLMAALKAKDLAGAEEAMKEAPPEVKDDTPSGEGDTHVHIHTGAQSGTAVMGDEPNAGALGNSGTIEKDDDPYEARFVALEAGHAEILKAVAELRAAIAGEEAAESGVDAEIEKELAGTGDEFPPKEEGKVKGATADANGKKGGASKFTDSAPLRDSFQAAAAGAEVLVPGIRIPTFDAKAAPKATFDAICKLRRTSLDLLNATPAGRALVEDLADGKALALDKMSCDAVRGMFNAAVAAKKAANRAGARTGDQPAKRTVGGIEVSGPVLSIAELNRRNAEHYAKQH